MSLLDNFPHRCSIKTTYKAKDEIAGTRTKETTEQTNVECWEQQASNSETMEFEKRGMNISKKIFFVTDPQVTTKHEIVITHRLGVAVVNPISYNVMSEPLPDSSAGLGVVYKVMVNKNLGSIR